VDRIAFGSCAKHWQAQPIWEAVIATEPDLFLYLGDAIYADTDGKTAWTVSEGQLRGEWNRLADKPEFQAARRSMPFMAVWDNHDYGSHAGGAEFELKVQSQAAFLDFFGEPAESERRRTGGIYDAKLLGPEGRRLQIILLDTKYFRSKPLRDPRPREERLALGVVGNFAALDDPTATLLGKAQWAWLETQLRQPADLRLICSSTQIIPDEKGMDEWGNFAHERRRLFDLIRSIRASEVLFLSGNVHFAEISRADDGPYPIHEFTSSGLTHVNLQYSAAPNRARVAGPCEEVQFGLIEIDWGSGSSPELTLSAINVYGEAVFSHRIQFPRH
jgi:alkaline phosphatase D